MDTLFKLIIANRPRAYGIAVVVVGWLALVPGMPDAIPAGMTTIIGILLGTEVHSAVMTTKKAAVAIGEAAQASAQAAVKDVDQAVTGVAGELTETAAAVAQSVASEVTSEVLKDVGLKRKDLAA